MVFGSRKTFPPTSKLVGSRLTPVSRGSFDDVHLRDQSWCQGRVLLNSSEDRFESHEGPPHWGPLFHKVVQSEQPREYEIPDNSVCQRENQRLTHWRRDRRVVEKERDRQVVEKEETEHSVWDTSSGRRTVG